jgi:hypothetical protein
MLPTRGFRKAFNIVNAISIFFQIVSVEFRCCFYQLLLFVYVFIFTFIFHSFKRRVRVAFLATIPGIVVISFSFIVVELSTVGIVSSLVLSFDVY